MANLPSAKKRIKQNERNRIRNRARKAKLKTETRKFQDAIHDGNLDAAKELLVTVTKKIDQTAAKGTLHKNTAARKKSRLARHLNAAVAANSG
ncbi:MAG: 30S ribosomal protein S20 [Planctomycetes bacterium]|nr:30S ribosomal protein S20 [Planctomycetota bacterium]